MLSSSPGSDARLALPPSEAGRLGTLLQRVQAIAAERGAEGLQEWMDRQGMGTEVMMAGDAQKKTEERKRRMMEQAEAAAKAAADAHSFDDLRDEDIDKTEL